MCSWKTGIMAMAGKSPEKAGIAVKVANPPFEVTEILPFYMTGSLCLTTIAEVVLHLSYPAEGPFFGNSSIDVISGKWCTITPLTV